MVSVLEVGLVLLMKEAGSGGNIKEEWRNIVYRTYK